MRMRMAVENEKIKNTHEIYTKIAVWQNTKAYREIVEAILNVSIEQRSYKLYLQLMLAYINLYQFDKALEVLEMIKEEGKEDDYWHFYYGYAQYYSDKKQEAIKAFKRAVELNPEDTFNKRWLERCENVLVLEKRKKGEIKAEPIKIIYDEQKEEYIVSEGIVDLGYMGIYLTRMMSVSLQDCDFDNKNMAPYIKREMKKAELAKGLTAYYQKRLDEMKQNQEEINNYFLFYIVQGFIDTEYHFWEENNGYAPFIIEEKMPKVSKQELEDTIFNPVDYTNEGKEWDELQVQYDECSEIKVKEKRMYMRL